MKISVSLTEADLGQLDRFVREHDLPTRSAGIRQAIALLSRSELESAYAEAWDEWDEAGEEDLWAATSGDGLAAR